MHIHDHITLFYYQRTNEVIIFGVKPFKKAFTIITFFMSTGKSCF